MWTSGAIWGIYALAVGDLIFGIWAAVTLASATVTLAARRHKHPPPRRRRTALLPSADDGPPHLTDLATELRRVHSAWAALHARADEVAALDPHRVVQQWQQQTGMPPLDGSAKQIRWAERIRYDAVRGAPAAIAGLAKVAATETSAGVWIELHVAGEL